MNASVEPIPVPLKPAVEADPLVREGILEVPGEVRLHHGDVLTGVRIAWRLAGPANAPIVCALGGISAHRRVFVSDAPREGWWSEVVGPGRALSTDRCRVLSFDYLGGSGETTGPREAGPHQAGPREAGSRQAEPREAGSHQAGSADGHSFPSISSYDQAELLIRLLNHLGIKSLKALVGGSYGGMVALAFGERYPERVGQLLVICAADRANAMATAWRSVQRRVVRFALECGRPTEGLQLARALAMSTYRSPEEFAARFGAGAPVREEDHFVFPVEQYLFARGGDYAARYRPEAFLCLSESIDLHQVDASRVFVPTTAIAFREDQLVPLADMRGLAARLPVSRLHEVSSIYGHDAFLKESDQLRAIFASTLGSVA